MKVQRYVSFMQQPRESLGLRFLSSTQGLQMCFCCGKGIQPLRSKYKEWQTRTRKWWGLHVVSWEAKPSCNMWLPGFRRAEIAYCQSVGLSAFMFSLRSRDSKLWRVSFVAILASVMAAEEYFFFLPSFLFFSPRRFLTVFWKEQILVFFPHLLIWLKSSGGQNSICGLLHVFNPSVPNLYSVFLCSW